MDSTYDSTPVLDLAPEDSAFDSSPVLDLAPVDSTFDSTIVFDLAPVDSTFDLTIVFDLAPVDSAFDSTIVFDLVPLVSAASDSTTVFGSARVDTDTAASEISSDCGKCEFETMDDFVVGEVAPSSERMSKWMAL